MKSEVVRDAAEQGRRSPHGERGLKLRRLLRRLNPPKSLPPRGAWIEITVVCCLFVPAMSLPPRGAWIEMITALVMEVS